jgi:uncharacterized protein
MATFNITSKHPESGQIAKFLYRTDDSALLHEDGTPVLSTSGRTFTDAVIFDKESPLKKSNQIKRLKISLGLSCNYECSYCSQRFVERSVETNPHDVDAFMVSLPNWFDGGDDGIGGGVSVEFWGGEPFVYWKTLKPLAEKIKAKYPNIRFSVITNGSLLDSEKNAWLDENEFTVSISHDAGGQSFRGPDPLTDEGSRNAVLDLYARLKPKGRFSFNTMIHAGNQSRDAAYEYFKRFTGDEDVPLGQGEFIDAYDEGGLGNSLKSLSDEIKFRLNSLTEMRVGKGSKFSIPVMKIQGFIDTVRYQKTITSISQKCGMDDPSNIAVDLNGNVITCQNTSASAIAPNGNSHKIGHVDDFENIRLDTATHLAKRSECLSCPVVHLCAGSCMFLEGDLFEASCKNSFSDNIVYFAAAFEVMTGFVPVYIDGNQREDRKDIFGMVNGIPANTRKPFPIPVVSA